MTPDAPRAAAAGDLVIEEVSTRGLVGRGERDAVLEVFFDDRSIWSLRFLRDSEPDGDVRLLPWPVDLRAHLGGEVRVTVREHASGVLLYEREVRLGTRAGRVAVVDEDGRPLSVNAKGHLTASLSQAGPQVLQTVLAAAEHVLALMAGVGVDGYLAYGTLLGAVRSAAVIPHDYDADLSYLSDHAYPVDAIAESYRIERAVRSGGYEIRRYSAMAFQVRLHPTDPKHPWLDVFGSLRVQDTLYVLWSVAAPLRRDQILPRSTCTLEGREFPAPRDPDAWLTAAYGPTWRVPDPAFEFDTPVSAKRRMSGWFGRSNRGQRPWNALHGASEHRVDEVPSDFARWVAGCEPHPDAVVDLGCGTGTDVLWYARGPFAAAQVSGLDFSAVALAKARARAAATGSSATFADLNLADLRSVLVTGASLARLPGNRLLTARFLADALNEAERANLWLLARMALRGGGLLYLEIALARDPRRPAFGDAHRLRRLPGPALRAEVEAAGAMVVERLAVESPPTTDVPDTTRMVLSWPS